MSQNKKLITLLATTGILMNSAVLPITTAAEEIDQTKESKYVVESNEDIQETKESLVDSTEEMNTEDLTSFEEQNDKQKEAIAEMRKVTEKNVSDTSLFDFNVTLKETGKLEDTIIEAIKWYDDNWYDLEAGYSRPDWGLQQNINITTTVPLNDADWETVRKIPELTYFTGAVTDLKNIDIVRLNSEGFDLDIPDNALNFDGGGTGEQSDPKIFNTWLRSFESNAKNIGSNFGAYTWSLENVVLSSAETISDNFLYYSFAKNTEYVTVNLPEAISIGNSAFYHSRIELVAPRLKKIGDFAFYSVSANTIELPALESAGRDFFRSSYPISSEIFIRGDGLDVLKYNLSRPINRSLKLELPNLVTLGEMSFHTVYLNEVSLPKLKSLSRGFSFSRVENLTLESVEVIENSFNYYSGDSLTNNPNMTINAPLLKYIDSSFRGKTLGLTLNAPLIEEIGSNSFNTLAAEVNINNFNFPNLVRVGDNSFNDKLTSAEGAHSGLREQMKLQSFIAPKLESVGQDFMKGVTALETLEAPNLNSVGKDSFSSWYSPTNHGYPAIDYPAPSLKKIEIGLKEVNVLQEFFEKSKESLIDLTMNSVEKIVDNDVTLESFKALESLTMNEVKTIGDNVLKDFENLNSVEMLKVEEFGESAFEQAVNLETVNLPNAISFGNNAFDVRSSDSKLKQINLPNAKKMGDNAFRGNSVLEEVTLPKLEELGDYAFYWTRNLKIVHLPNLKKIGTESSFGGPGFQALIFNKGNLNDTIIDSIFKGKPEVLGVLTEGNTTHELNIGDQLKLGETDIINEETATIERSFSWDKDGAPLPHSLSQYHKESVEKEDAGIYTSKILLNNKEYSLGTHEVLVSNAPDIVTFETDDYHVGDYNITGRFSAPIVTAQLRINGNISNRGGTFNKTDGTFYYYAGAGRIQVDQEVVLEGLNEQGEIVKSVKIEPKIKEGSLDNVQYTLGDNTIEGEYTGEVSKARLVVNGTIVSVGGTFAEGKFNYYVNPSQIKETDTILMQGYDAKGDPIGNLAPVALQKQQGKLIEANYKVGEATITGKYEGDVKKARLIVDDKPISWGGTFKDGEFSYYVSPGTIKEDSKVELAVYGTGDYLLSQDNFMVDVKSDHEK